MVNKTSPKTSTTCIKWKGYVCNFTVVRRVIHPRALTTTWCVRMFFFRIYYILHRKRRWPLASNSFFPHDNQVASSKLNKLPSRATVLEVLIHMRIHLERASPRTCVKISRNIYTRLHAHGLMDSPDAMYQRHFVSSVEANWSRRLTFTYTLWLLSRRQNGMDSAGLRAFIWSSSLQWHSP